jgi:CubicO group peptidase (beta-lactamase class C family)
VVLFWWLHSSSHPALSFEYLRRFFVLAPSGTQDWARLPSRTVARPEVPFRYPADPAAATRWDEALRKVTYLHDGQPRTVILDQVLTESGTTAFIVVHDGAVVRETYFNGHQRDSMTRVFSVSKSFTSALVGVALAEGRIRSVDDPFVEYLPELRARGYDDITIRHLLLMAGGFRFTGGRRPWKDGPLLYWHPDVRSVILEGPPVIAPPGERFHYSSYSTVLLGMILERVTGSTMSRYFERNIWKRIGAEYDATWTLDHADSGLENAAAGFNARAIDIVKLGTLYLRAGEWGGQQVVPASWVAESVKPLPAELPGHSEREVREHVFYKYGWWGHALEGGRTCFYAEGLYGQVIYICPDKRLVVARFGRKLGSVDQEWPMLMRAVADSIP